MSFGHPPYWPHRPAGQPPTREERATEFSGFPPEGPLQLTATMSSCLSCVFISVAFHKLVVPEQHFCAAMFSSTSVHFGEAILDWIALEDTTLLRKTRKSPRCSSAVCCLRIKAEKQYQTNTNAIMGWDTNLHSLLVWVRGYCSADNRQPRHF